jgi:hypothetical protein
MKVKKNRSYKAEIIKGLAFPDVEEALVCV